jgi:predicted PurR-regulated permease PerM
MNNYFPDMENPWVRRPLIILMALCAAPFLLLLIVAEVLWETAKAIVEIVKNQIKETAPTFRNIVNQIKETW